MGVNLIKNFQIKTKTKNTNSQQNKVILHINC